MKKVSGFVIGSLLLSFFVLVYSGSLCAATLYVDRSNTSGVEDGSVNHPYNTIMEGINNAANGDTIRVSAGTYNENVTISAKQISLIGESPSDTTIQAANNVISISGSYSPGYVNVEIAGFTITGGTGAGIYINSSTAYGIIHNNIIIGNTRGITSNASIATISNNTVASNSSHGIYGYSSGANLSVSNNIVIQNGGYGIFAYNYGVITSIYNNSWANTSGDYYESGAGGTAINQTGDVSLDPQFLANYQLSISSPSIDGGRPIAADNDPDGTRNNHGAYGGPGAAAFWPSPTGGPVVTNLSVTPPSVPTGGTISIQATGEIR